MFFARGASLALLFAVASSACSGADGTGSSSTSSGSAPSMTTARCVGSAVEAYTIDDRESCAKQGSDWDSTYGECRGTTFSVHCSRADEAGLSSADDTKQMCLDMPGCGYTEANGTVTYPTGHCEGTKTPCSALTQATCHQTGCYFTMTDGCAPLNGSNWLDNAGCDNLQISKTVSFSVVRSACQRAMGCTWAP